MKVKAKTIFSLAVLLAAALVGCSKAGFNADHDNSANGPDGFDGGIIVPPGATREDFNADVGTEFQKVDVLFVLDESASMSSVIANFRLGFASLASAVYPPDTKIGVTNMAPALYVDAANGI